MVPSGVGAGPSRTVPGGSRFTHVAHARGGRLSAGGERAVLESSLGRGLLLCSSCNMPLSWNKTAGGGPSHLGWVRAASPQLPTRDPSKACRMADKTGEGGGEFDIHPDEQVWRLGV